MNRVALRIAVLGLSALPACSLLVDAGGLVGGPRDAGSSADAALDAIASADSADAAAAPDVDPRCAAGGGSTMIAVTDRSCIDATEATRAQYAKFLAAIGAGAAPGLPSVCSFKTTHVPGGRWPPAAGDQMQPVTYVDWCDAWAFCAWTGKHLCGSIKGGPVTGNDSSNAASDLWYRACSNAGALTYPWGSAFDGAKCNGPSAGANGVVAVGSKPSCMGGLSGLFDMAGNAQEWQDSCDGNTASSGCADRGGAFVHHDVSPTEEVRLQCGHRDTTARNSQSDNNGIRCCKVF